MLLRPGYGSERFIPIPSSYNKFIKRDKNVMAAAVGLMLKRELKVGKSAVAIISALFINA